MSEFVTFARDRSWRLNEWVHDVQITGVVDQQVRELFVILKKKSRWVDKRVREIWRWHGLQPSRNGHILADGCCDVLQFVAARCRVLPCVAVCCSVLQCVAACIRVKSRIKHKQSNNHRWSQISKKLRFQRMFKGIFIVARNDIIWAWYGVASIDWLL